MRRLTGSLMAAGLLATGGMTGAALGLGLPAGADDVTAGGAPEISIEEPESGRLREVLDGLVEQGTITSEQADAVAQALRDAAPKLRHFAHHLDLAGEALRAAAGVIGMDEAELRTALEAGQSLAEVAEEHGVNRTDLLAGLTEAASQRLDAAVADGDITAEQAEAMKTRLAEVLEDVVDRSLDEGRPGFPGPDRIFGRGFPGGPFGRERNGPD